MSERFFPLPRFEGLDETIRQTGSITAAFAACGLSDYTRQESRIIAKIPSAEIAAHLGEVHWVTGNKEKAGTIWREGLMLKADNETLLETLKQFNFKP